MSTDIIRIPDDVWENRCQNRNLLVNENRDVEVDPLKEA